MSELSFLRWMALAGALMLLMALGSSHLRRLPLSTAAVYLAVGCAIGPLGLDWLEIELDANPSWFTHLSAIAVIVALFIGGLKLRLPLRHASWRAAFRLALPAMLLTIGGVAAVGVLGFGLDVSHAILLGAVLAPTDPVLASAVSVNDAADDDRVRYGLSGEAGLNDGLAFPFVLLALLMIESGGGPGSTHEWLWSWAALHLLWSIPAALAIGYVLGRTVGAFAIRLRSLGRETGAPNDLLALALIALAFVGAEAIGALGFLSVFAAGVGLRHAEVRVVHETPHPDSDSIPAATDTRVELAHPPAESFAGGAVGGGVERDDMRQPAIAAGVLVGDVLSFGDTAERLLELAIIVTVGAMLAVHWDARAIPLAAALFLLVRPVAVVIALVRTPTSAMQRALMGWFGVRGVGSLFYLGYVLQHGAAGSGIDTIVDLTVSVVALSILVHGTTTSPILAMYHRLLSRRGAIAAEPVRAS